MSQATSARAARPFALVVSLAVATVVAAACTPAVKQNGEACIKDYDCLSGSCVQQVCVAQGPLLDAQPPFVDATAEAAADGGADAAGSSSSSGSSSSGSSSGSSSSGSSSSSSSSSSGGASDSGNEAAVDDGGDAATDAKSD